MALELLLLLSSLSPLAAAAGVSHSLAQDHSPPHSSSPAAVIVSSLHPPLHSNIVSSSARSLISVRGPVLVLVVTRHRPSPRRLLPQVSSFGPPSIVKTRPRRSPLDIATLYYLLLIPSSSPSPSLPPCPISFPIVPHVRPPCHVAHWPAVPSFFHRISSSFLVFCLTNLPTLQKNYYNMPQMSPEHREVSTLYFYALTSA